jgi:hypothetical protein
MITAFRFLHAVSYHLEPPGPTVLGGFTIRPNVTVAPE